MVCVCVVESWARLALRNWFGGEGGEGLGWWWWWWTGPDWAGLDWIGLD